MQLRRVAAAGFAALACACDPEMLIGEDPVDGAAADATIDGATTGGGGDAGTDGGGTALADASPIIFTTGFEDGLNDFGLNCYSGPGTAGTYNLVGPPPDVFGYAHSGSYALAFSIQTAASFAEARCFVNSGLPDAAYYSAWFYILSNVTASSGWNLLHWQGPLSDGGVQNLWDVSLNNEADGSISPVVIDYTRNRQIDSMQPIPIGAYFHLEAYMQRSDTSSGAFNLYLNGTPIVEIPSVSTVSSESFGFHIGDYADSLTPTSLVLYVDDVTISTAFVP